MMRSHVRSFLRGNAPALFDWIRAVRNRQYFRKQFASFQHATCLRLFRDQAPITVLTGPFKGLRYFNEIVWGSITSKWLGSYEAELHPLILRIIDRAYTPIIDVGCAEGYYAVGLASVLPQSKIIAFDTDHLSRNQLRRLSELNDVTDRVEIRSYCRHADLESLSNCNTLVICDIEGFEAELLDPVKAPSLLQCDILVEVHESPVTSTDVEDRLARRFASSHCLERIEAVSRDVWLVQHQTTVAGLDGDWQVRATDENRVTGRVWLWMQVREQERKRDVGP